jgi:hypothetical protein
VLAILAILAALLVPHVGGFLAWGHRAAYDAYRHTLELSVIAYYTADPVVRVWPIWGASVGRPVDENNNNGRFDDLGDAKNGLIHIWKLYHRGFIAGMDAVRSADGRPGRHGHGILGSYVWYVADGDGTVRSLLGDGTRWLSGFQGVWP